MKAKILRDHFEEKASVRELCEKHGMHPTAFYHKRTSQTTKDSERIKKLEERLKKKESVISEIVSEKIEYKKKLNGEY